MKLSIIIVTYNSLDYIKECIDSIKCNIGIAEYQIIVVDNTPIEKAQKMHNLLMKYYDKEVKYIHNSNNFGYGQGNNVGIKNSNGEIICIMNPDIIITNKNLFKNALSQFTNNDNLGMLGYKQLGGRELSFYFRQEYFFPFLTAILTKILNKLNVFNSKFMFLSGAFFFTKRDIFSEIGNFDESFFLYNEEADITIRLLSKKYSIKYIKDISYIHNIGNRGASSLETFKTTIDSACLYLEKHQYNKDIFLLKTKIELTIKLFLSRIMRKEATSNIYQKKISYLQTQI